MGRASLIRASCDYCGAHNETRMSSTGPAGCCRNCGCADLTPIAEISDESVRRAESAGWADLPIAHPAC